MGAPPHDKVMEVWTEAVKNIGDEVCILMLPSADGLTVNVSGFQPTTEHDLDECVSVAVEVMRPRLRQPCNWIAMACPGYYASVEVENVDDARVDDMKHGDLALMYATGDPMVKDVVTVLTTEFALDAPILAQSYVQPLLEPLDPEPGPMDPNGAMAFVLRTALLVANLPKDA
jgi:hypothetical protein